MAHPLLYPGKTFFYPIGNTPPCCLTDGVPPEQSANLLLLGCGDPRNLLFTVHSSRVSDAMPRKLDFTCCDHEPAVLARNAVLLTMIVDGEIPHNAMWNIFYDLMIKKEVVHSLVAHCQKLVKLSADVMTWNNAYGTWLKMCTVGTLQELRRHWILYVGFPDLSQARKKQVNESFSQGMREIRSKWQNIASIARSAGIFAHEAIKATSEHFSHLWRTGVHSTEPKDTIGATLLNQTFVYSLMGEQFNVHYGVDGLASFHLAPAFVTFKPSGPPKKITPQSLIDCAQGQFKDWCQSFRAAICTEPSNVAVRLFAGDALHLCRALHMHLSDRSISTGVYASPWSAVRLNLDGGEYDVNNHHAPTTFDVIDTSNLSDHLGLLNVLIATRPLLSHAPYSSINTEALLAVGSDPTSGFMGEVGGDLTSISIVLDLTPSTFVARSTTYSNRHEVVLHRLMDSPQYHERVVWKILTASDSSALRVAGNAVPTVLFKPEELSRFLFHVYLKMFASENTLSAMLTPSLEKLRASSRVHYIRATFAMFIKLVKERTKTDWGAVIDQLLELIESDRTLMMGMNYYQDLCCHLYLFDIHTVSTLTPRFVNIVMGSLSVRGRFQNWEEVPPVVCITLVVPRQKLKVIEDIGFEKIGTPPLQCDIQGFPSHAVFFSIAAAFGKVTRSGPEHSPELTLEEDPLRWSGKSDLVVSFWIPSWIILKEPNSAVGFGLRATPATTTLIGRLGMELLIFRASLLDKVSVQVTRARPSFPDEHRSLEVLNYSPRSRTGRPITVHMDEGGVRVESVSTRVDITGTEEISILESGEKVSSRQISPCGVELSLSRYSHPLYFPFPVDHSRVKLRIARKSHFVEVIIPVSGPFTAGGFSVDPFPVIFQEHTPTVWNMHRLHLDSLPFVSIERKANLDSWLNTHVSLMMSDRERAIMNGGKTTGNQDPLQTLVDVKESLHAIFVQYAGIQGEKRADVFALHEPTMGGGYTLLFITGLRLDCSAHTVVLDAFVLPITDAIMPRVGPAIPRLMKEGLVSVVTVDNEMRAWKRLLPAFVERCRLTWTHGPECAYVKTGRVPLSLEVNENPLCACGQGKDVALFTRSKLWAPLAPLVTRAALSPLFAASYLETRSAPSASVSIDACALCGGGGQPRLLKCSRCKRTSYCSSECQRADWKKHKVSCR
ncbi:hypothetical protein FA95DRAFT_1485634 [Auriscalpium vulgare]|uniref:Uncharacterized protein n=1 Tax=Auriscalpium vulgare TaxID=40419 RepID=A0ACB8S4F7_9AGAM|nr:hypothetical protein FA95DRAFT_1485634 [Auriscalpium vulgare]